MRVQPGCQGVRPGGRGGVRVRGQCIRRRLRRTDQGHDHPEARRASRPRHQGHDWRPLGVASSRVHPEQGDPADAGGQGSRRPRSDERRGSVPLRAPEPADEAVPHEVPRDEARCPSQRISAAPPHRGRSRFASVRTTTDRQRPAAAAWLAVTKCPDVRRLRRDESGDIAEESG
jgi:hypothetical protein